MHSSHIKGREHQILYVNGHFLLSTELPSVEATPLFELEREGCCHSKPHFSTKYNKQKHCEASVQKIRVPLVTIVIQNNNNTNQICKPFQSYAAGLGYHSLKILSNAKLSKTEQCWGNNAPMLMAHTFLEMPRTTSGN